MEKRVPSAVLANYDLSKLQDSLEEAEGADLSEMERDKGGSAQSNSSDILNLFDPYSPGGQSSELLFDGLNPIKIVAEGDKSESNSDDEDADPGDRGADSDESSESESDHGPDLSAINHPPKSRDNFFNINGPDKGPYSLRINPEVLQSAPIDGQLELLCELLHELGTRVGFSVKASGRYFAIDKIEVPSSSIPPGPVQASGNVYARYKERLKVGFKYPRKKGGGLLLINEESFNVGSLPEDIFAGQNFKTPEEVLRFALARKGVLAYVQTMADL
ncbi:phosphoprotein [Klamath virus]|uniref:Phosphoprotein n=1 Tax=Klamath virus TaxID=909206 RepID=A0A0D3R129_9RHAB|nr:phosphoprotein [Klamath virus]AJR28404.1 phosphoprotein [Klamath virus]